MERKNIRNFSIIAHIDHGKSTLADRILEITNTVNKREMKEQLLDSMELERERGITIKLNAIQLNYQSNNKDYTFHLIDTPGHVDFNYEVSRSLAACEGAILVVDAAQGIEAQTLANVYLALENDLEIIVVLNKVDLPAADPERVKKEIEDVIGLDTSDAIEISAKTGKNVDLLLEEIVKKIPPPKDIYEDQKLRGLIFDSHFDTYRGVMISVRIMSGSLKKGDRITLMSLGKQYEVIDLGINQPQEVKKDILIAGEVGWISAGIKDIRDTKVGDTITLSSDPVIEVLQGYKELNPMVYSGLYPIDTAKYNDLRDSLEKMQLSDSSLVYDPETSQALGFGFRCGFLGLLHMEIIQERLEREFNLELIATAPSVIYQVTLTNGKVIQVDNPSKMPDNQQIDKIEEPFVKANIMSPDEYVGSIMELCQRKRGVYQKMTYMDETRVNIEYKLPLAEIVYDFFDQLKSKTKGYASFDYEMIGYSEERLVKVDILLNTEVVDALAVIMHKDFAHQRGKIICEKLKDIIPRQQFEVPIQAAIGSKIVSRTTIKAMRKNVLAKCYGGDVSRKKKLLEKQKKGKKRLKSVGSIEIPQEAFVTVLSIDE